jgi:hypothetical protein
MDLPLAITDGRDGWLPTSIIVTIQAPEGNPGASVGNKT